MIVAGVMSGTSADGINVALVSFSDRLKRARTPDFHRSTMKLIGHIEFPFPRDVRRFILATMNSTRASVPDLARLNFLLGELYADAVLAAQRRFRVTAELVGCHGQTIYHQGETSAFLGRKLAVTWQTGEAAVIAARVGVPVVSDFRPADMAAGGKGAPLVPLLDYFLYRDRRRGRIIQNIGGIANLTAIPPGASLKQVVAFDTGPGNMVIDAVTERLFGRPFDRDGRIAASGRVLPRVLSQFMRHPFFRRKPPKTTGREEFGSDFAREFIRRCGRADKRDVVATATALTSASIGDALRRFVLRRLGGNYGEFIVSGGGAQNPTLLTMLADQLRSFGLQVRFSDEFGLPSEAKEAVAFALLAYETWHHQPSNVPAATGARKPAILGKISYA
jgi:anhydro-N-acetylmuramic acid kinase